VDSCAVASAKGGIIDIGAVGGFASCSNQFKIKVTFLALFGGYAWPVVP